MVLKINNVDLSEYIASYSPYKNTMVTNEQRNAKGTLTFDIVSSKTKIECQTIDNLTETQVQEILSAVESYKVSCQYRDTATGTSKTINAYVPDLKPEPKQIIDGKTIYNSFGITVIEM